MTSLACLAPPATPIGHTDGMSLLETMAISRHDRLGRKSIAWEQAHPDYRDRMMREAAADIRALIKVLHPVLW
jgi:hypothetical protein